MSERVVSQLARERVTRVWAFRARVEVETACRFARLADELRQTGASSVVVALAERAATDELRHAGLCDTLIAHFGGTPKAREACVAGPVGPSSVTRRERVLFEVIAMSCITETVSAAALKAMLDSAGDPLVRDIVHSILRDEVKHSRLGWAHLAAERDKGPLGFVADCLPEMLAQTVTSDLFDDVAEDQELARALAASGALPRAARKRVFVDSLRELVFPGFEHFGIDTTLGQRWLDGELSRPTSAISQRIEIADAPFAAVNADTAA
jgi:hypothetical protein